MNTKNLVGSKYGKLTVIDIAPRGKGGQARWECKCACGETRKVEEYALKKGLVVSCGCYKREMQTKHNMSRTKIYKVWAAMKQRCGNENDKSYNNYGDRTLIAMAEYFKVSTDYLLGVSDCKRSKSDNKTKEVTVSPNTIEELGRALEVIECSRNTGATVQLCFAKRGREERKSSKD